jgi:ferrous-iron efflux pump FieF
MLTQRVIEHIPLGMGVMLVSVVVSLGLTVYLKLAAKRLNSVALAADSLHYASDVFTGIGTLIALAAYSYAGWWWLDPVVSALIAVGIGYSAFTIGRESIDQLMDHELPLEDRTKIEQAVLRASTDVFGTHELRTRRSGRTIVVDLHVEVRASVTFQEAHEVTERVQHAIESLFDECIATIHPDPYLAPGRPADGTESHNPEDIHGVETTKLQ